MYMFMCVYLCVRECIIARISLTTSSPPPSAEKPAIVAELEDVSFCLEDDAVFTLRASGLPLPDVEWKLHDKVVKADERHVFTNPEPGVYCMTIKDVCMSDYGPVSNGYFVVVVVVRY